MELVALERLVPNLLDPVNNIREDQGQAYHPSPVGNGQVDTPNNQPKNEK
jgi:hypothetical protein